MAKWVKIGNPANPALDGFSTCHKAEALLEPIKENPPFP